MKTLVLLCLVILGQFNLDTWFGLSSDVQKIIVMDLATTYLEENPICNKIGLNVSIKDSVVITAKCVEWRWFVPNANNTLIGVWQHSLINCHLF